MVCYVERHSWKGGMGVVFVRKNPHRRGRAGGAMEGSQSLAGFLKFDQRRGLLGNTIPDME
jgi:hypothetical protein